MKCLILAAGYATRLYPLTENFPKPLLTVGDKTILDWLVDDIDGANLVDEYVVISNHKYAHHFDKWAASKSQKITIVDDGTDTNETRLGAVKDIQFAIEKLGLKHKEHIAAYGEGNERRLTGRHETADINTFLWGVANRGASIRVGRDTEKEGKGYFEDRRPASNMDPYVVTSMIAETTLLWKP